MAPARRPNAITLQHLWGRNGPPSGGQAPLKSVPFLRRLLPPPENSGGGGRGFWFLKHMILVCFFHHSHLGMHNAFRDQFLWGQASPIINFYLTSLTININNNMILTYHLFVINTSMNKMNIISPSCCYLSVRMIEWQSSAFDRAALVVCRGVLSRAYHSHA